MSVKRDQLAKSWFIHIMKANCFKKKKKANHGTYGKRCSERKIALQTINKFAFCKQD